MDIPWGFALAFNGIAATAFMVMAGLILGNLGRRWRENPLATTTALIFLSCCGLHLVRCLQMTVAVSQPVGSVGLMRDYYSHPAVLVVDAMVAASTTAYLALRRRFPTLASGPMLYEDLRRRHQEALTFHDRVVQEATMAKWSLEMGDSGAARRGLDAAIANTLSVLEGLREPTVEGRERTLRPEADG